MKLALVLIFLSGCATNHANDPIFILEFDNQPVDKEIKRLDQAFFGN